MIPVNFIEEWREKAPWQTLEMVEQDLVISRGESFSKTSDLFLTKRIWK